MTSQYFGGNISGGAVGGYHALESYHEGTLSAQKALLIRNIAHDLASALKLPSDIASEPLDRVISTLKSRVPNPKTHSLSKSSDVQRHVCQAMAEALNRRYGRHIIDTTASPAEVCERVSELMQTLFSSVKGEFLPVAQDVRRTLGNLAILRKSLESSFSKLYSTVQMGSDDVAKLQSYGIEQLYKDLLSEVDRQMAILANLVNVTIDPATRTIAELTEQDKDFRGFVKSLKSEFGSADLSRKLTGMLAGVSSVAVLADTIDRALKKVGHSVQEYRRFRNTPALLEHLYEVFERPGHSATSDELAKFVAAVQLVKDNDYAYDDIVSHLSSRANKVKAAPRKALRRAAGKSRKVRGRGVGGAEGENSLEKRIERQRKSREVLFRDFEMRLEQQYKAIFGAIEVLSKRLGSQIPIDDHLQQFVRCMQDLDQAGGVDRDRYYLSLTGYLTDAASKEERQRFLGQLDAVIKSLKPLMSGPAGEHFRTIHSAIERVVETIDTFKDTYLKPITSINIKPMGGGSTLDSTNDDYSDDSEEDEAPQNKSIHMDDDRTLGYDSASIPSPQNDNDDDDFGINEFSYDDSATGGARKRRPAKRVDNVRHELQTAERALDKAQDAANQADHAVDEAEAAIEKAEDAIEHVKDAVTEGGADGEGTFVTLGQAIRHLEFFFNVARVKHNLDIASKDIRGYSKDYEVVLGDAVGDVIIQIKRAYEKAKKELEPSTQPLANDAYEARLVKQWIDVCSVPAPALAFQQAAGAVGAGQIPVHPATDKPQYGGSWAKAKEMRKSIRDNALMYLKETMNVKIDLLKTIEAIDIYLANFADAVASNPQDIKDLNQLLKSVDTVAKWYTDKSCNSVVDFFESAPSALADIHEIDVPDQKSFPNSTESHYYEWVGNLIKPDGGVRREERLPGNPFLGRMPGVESDDESSHLEQVLEKAKKASMSVRVLDNIVSAFAKLGSQYGSLNLNNKTFMPPGVIFKNIRKYIYHSAIVMGYGEERQGNKVYGALKSATDIPRDATAPAFAVNALSHVANGAVLVGTDGFAANHTRANNAAAIAAARPDAQTLLNAFTANGGYANINHYDQVERHMRNKFAFAFSSIYDGDKPVNGFKNTWYQTDQFLIMAIKSMVAKVFTVIGTYGVFNRPLDKYKNLSSTRLILGGASDMPEIIPGAVELYIRLPLLAEFYRELFDFAGTNAGNAATAQTDNKKITMVPEFNGIWENFVRIVFEDAKYVVEGTYSETHVRALIREINDIYNKFRGADGRSVIQDVISAFVAEVNRRYGVVKQTEIDSFMKERRRYETTYDAFTPEERLDYNILDERDQNGRRPAPSDRFDHMFPPEERKIDNPWKNEYVTLVRNFRDRLDSKIKTMIPTGRNRQRVSFDQTVRAYKQQVENARSSDEKYKIILKAMQGVDQLSNVNQYKAVMFHEAVLAPLGTLYSIWSTLFKFTRTSEAFDLTAIWNIIDAHTMGAGPHTYAGYYTALQNARKGYERYLKLGDVPHQNHARNGVQYELPSFTKAAPANGAAILVHRGVYGARADIVWNDIRDLAAAARVANLAEDKREANKEGIRRFVVDSELMFRDMINESFALASDLGDMAQVKVQQHNFLIEYGSLSEQCQALLDHVKKNLELFRGVIDRTVISRIEGGLGPNNQPDAGSLYFIEEHLMERIFKESRQTRPSGRVSYGTGILKTNEILSRTFKGMTQTWNVIARFDYDAAHRYFTGPTVPGNVEPSQLREGDKALYEYEKTLLRDSFERPMAELLYWGPSKGIGAGAANRTLPGGGGIHQNAAGAAIPSVSTLGHTMRQPTVRNKSVNEWPFAVIPAIDRTNAEDDDLKNLKSLHDSMKALQNEIKATLDPAALGNADTVFRWAVDGTPVGVGGLAQDVFGVEADPQLIAAYVQAPVGAAAGIAPPPGRIARARDLAERYNALTKQRERILQNTAQAPFNHRMKWYVDPSNSDEGAWFLGQLDPREARSGVYDAPPPAAGQPDLSDINGSRYTAGLLVRLNEILSKYLYMGWDPTTKKMYQGLIAKFAGGSHVAASNKGQALNDVDDVWFTLENDPASAGLMGVPAAHVTVFASLARAMRNVLSNTRRTGTPEFRADSMMELPIHVKETLRGALPHFDKLFKLVIKKAELLRQVSQQVSLVRQVPYLLKYGINRAHANTVDQNNVVFRGANGCQQYSDVTTAAAGAAMLGSPAFANNAVLYGHAGATIDAQHAKANAALLDSRDVMHVPTGFVIRNASPNLQRWVAGQANVAAYIAGGLAPPAFTPWISGAAPAGGAIPPFPDQKRYTDVHVNCMRVSKSDPTAYVGFAAYEELDESAGKRWHTELIDSIANMAISLSKCCTDTYKELADEPKYLETHEGFITDYVNLNKTQPLMVVSQMQVALRPRWRNNPADQQPAGGEWDIAAKEGYAYPNFALPLYRSGETAFKFNYGTRLVLGRPEVKPTLEYMPGMATLLEKYNGVTTGDGRLDKSDFERFCVTHTNLLRFMVDLRYYRAVLDTGASGRRYEALNAGLTTAPPGSDLFDAPLDIARVTGNDATFRQPTEAHRVVQELMSYPAKSTLDESIAITESGDQDDTLRSLAGTVSKVPGAIRSRDDARIWNILDMNIVPINLHALMRELPLVNLINYSYTCDRMIQDALIPEVELQGNQKGHIIPNTYQVANSSQMLAKILIYPYEHVSNTEFYGYLARIATGDSGLDLGRPKFISDQLWNKLLLQELYTQPLRPVRGIRRPDESGPAADNAQRRALKAFHENPDTIAAAMTSLITPANWFLLNNFIAPFVINRASITAAITHMIGVVNAAPSSRGIALDANLSQNESVIAFVSGIAPLLTDVLNTARTRGFNAQIGNVEVARFRQLVNDVNHHDAVLARLVANAGVPARQYISSLHMLAGAILFKLITEQLANTSEPDHYENNGVLSFPKKDNDERTVVTQITLGDNPANHPGTAVRSDLAMIGRMRFDTTFARNLFFLVNLQRVMRMIMRDEVSYLESPVVNSAQVLNREVTEFESNETYDAEVFHH